MIIRDGDWTLVDHDVASGRTVWNYFDGKIDHYRTDYPVSATLSENKEMRNGATKAWTGDWHKIASIPLNMVHDENLGLSEAFSQDDMDYISKWLNDSDNSKFRTKEGTV